MGKIVSTIFFCIFEMELSAPCVVVDNTGCFLVDVREVSRGSGCWCSAADVAAEASSCCEGLTSVF